MCFCSWCVYSGLLCRQYSKVKWSFPFYFASITLPPLLVIREPKFVKLSYIPSNRHNFYFFLILILGY